VEVPIKLNKKGNYIISNESRNPGCIYWVDGRVSEDTKWVYGYNPTDIPIILEEGVAPNIDCAEEDSMYLVEASRVVPGVSKEARERLQKVIKKFQEQIEKKPWGTDKYEHKIELRDEFVNRCNAYVYGPKEKDFQSLSTKEMLEKGIIRKSKEANVSPSVVAHHPRTKKMRKRENHIMPRVWETLQLCRAFGRYL
jgi:hypothetical protein